MTRRDIAMIIPEDADWMLEVTQRFNEKYFDVPLNLNKSLHFIQQVIEHPACVGFRSKSGYIIGGFEEDPMRDWLLLKEYGWFCEDRSGLALLNEFELHGVKCGVNEIRMTSLGSNKRVARLLQRRGYTELETSHVKRL